MAIKNLNIPSVIEEVDLNFYYTIINLNFYKFMWLVTIFLNNTVLEEPNQFIELLIVSIRGQPTTFFPFLPP